jgi:tetratricopeptide (TPR) repeat protein
VLEAAQASLAIAKQIEHRQWLTSAHWQLGVLYLDLLALPEALQHLEQALTLAHELGSWNWIRIASGFLAPLHLLQQDLTKAEAILTAAIEADAAMQTIGQRLVWAACAELALARRNPGMALENTDRLIASAANLTEDCVIPRLWKLRGEALAGLGRPEEAATTLRAAQEAARTQGLQSLQWRICVSLGKLYQGQGRHKEAEQAFATARTIIEELASTIADESLRDNFTRLATRMFLSPSM